jgi:hypothetical protein
VLPQRLLNHRRLHGACGDIPPVEYEGNYYRSIAGLTEDVPARSSLTEPGAGHTHDMLACWFGVSRSTITRAIGEVRPLLAERGCTVEDGVRLRTLADVVAHLGATGQLGLLDATEVRVRRPAAHKAGQQRFVSGKARASTVKALVPTDPAGRLPFCGQTRPGSVHDLTRVRQAGLVEGL